MLLTIVCVISTVVMAVYVLWFYHGSYHEETEQTIYDKYYMMITEDNKSSIWRSIYQGACEQAMKENVYVDWLGMTLTERKPLGCSVMLRSALLKKSCTVRLKRS